VTTRLRGKWASADDKKEKMNNWTKNGAILTAANGQKPRFQPHFMLIATYTM